jgi:hypothetical protein
VWIAGPIFVCDLFSNRGGSRVDWCTLDIHINLTLLSFVVLNFLFQFSATFASQFTLCVWPFGAVIVSDT